MMFWLLFIPTTYLVLSGKLKYEKNPDVPTAVAQQDWADMQPSQRFRYQLTQNPRVDNANQPWNPYTPYIMQGYPSDQVQENPLMKPGNSEIMNDLSTIWSNLMDAFGGNDAKYRLESTDSLPSDQVVSPDTKAFQNTISGVYL